MGQETKIGKVTLLGTGTSQGVPVIGCSCKVCTSPNPKNNRTRTSILVESDTTTIVVDTGPDFRTQMLRENVQKLDAVVLTHEHKDHIAGLDDVRPFNFKQKKDLPIYATKRVQNQVKNEFYYAFGENKYPGVPQLKLFEISNNSKFSINDITLLTAEVLHYKLPVTAFRIGDFGYITDASYIEDSELKKFEGISTLVITGLRYEKHISHFTVGEAIEIGNKLKCDKIIITHISHLLGEHEEESQSLPKHVELGYDGMKIDIKI